VTLLFDAGAFIALERGHPGLEARLRLERAYGRTVATHGGIIGQVWRDGGRQALLARALRLVTVVPLTAAIGRDAGRLLASTGGTDVIDAALVALAQDGDEIITSDPDDLARLAAAAGLQIDLLVV
jgi:predicted nucleic acid-binding protein